MKKFVNMLSFIAVVCIALALLFAVIFGTSGRIGSALELVGQIIAYLVVATYAFFYIKNKRKLGWIITYVVAVTIIIVILILPAFGIL